jgi:hypothetical protein
MIEVFVRFPVHGKNIDLAKKTISDLLKNHFPEIKWKIDGSIDIPLRRPRLIGQSKE